ncbi:Ribokinase-like protein [Backusella circina FSU 941]|nr:Ribokinase-like protein [Backusella circina FSU 941]
MTLPLYGSMGSLIIDDIRYLDGTEEHDVIGGAGVFAIYGMRLWQDKHTSKTVGFVAQCGFDHPKAITQQLEQLDISLIQPIHPDKHTTRGLNTFGPNDHRDFEYIHPIIRTTPSDFPDSWIESMECLHIISSAERALEVVEEWREKEAKFNKKRRTTMIWEPVPWDCIHEKQDAIIETCREIDIISPNHEELADILGIKVEHHQQKEEDIKESVEKCATAMFNRLEQTKALVVRAGKNGAFVVSNHEKVWVPAYWNKPEVIVDVTGAGNAFCGGYCVGWVETGQDPVRSAYYGSVSASFVIEQVGVPTLTLEGDTEVWNKELSPRERLQSMLRVSSK